MLTVLCVLRSGGIYDASWVEKLARGVARNLTVPHRVACLSDVPVPCERVPLLHDWPGWWSKVEIFRPGLVTGPTLYLDLDTVIRGNIDALASLPYDFAMLRGFGRRHYVGSGVMWFGKPRHDVYERFAEAPQRYIDEYATNPGNRHQAFNAAVGDQAFIFDVIGNHNIARLTDAVPDLIKLWPKHADRHGDMPAGCAVVCFKGKRKPPDAAHLPFMRGAWA